MGNSIGGSIDMKLAEPVFNCHKTLNIKSSNVYQTVNNSLNESINFHGNIKNFAYRISGVFRHADSYRSGGNQIISNSYFTKYNTSINLAYKLNVKHFLKFDYIGDWGRDIGFPALSMDVGKANAGIYSLSHIYLSDLSGILQSSESRLYANQIVHEMDDTKRNNVPIHMDMPGWSETIGCFNESKFKIRKFNIDTRIDAHKVYLRADMTMYPPNEASMYMQTLPAHELRNAGGFMNISRPVFSNQKLAIQARIDYYRLSIYNGFGADQLSAFNINVNDHINNILKSFAINWSIRLNQSWSAGMQVSSGERIASSNERLGFYLFNRFDAFDYLGNIKLKNEKSNQIEMSISYMKEKFTCNSKLFFHHNPDAIYAIALPGYSPMTYMAKGVKTYTNIDFARYMGFETAFKLSIIEDIKYMGSFRYTYSTNSFNYAMPLTPPFKFQNCIQWTTNKNNIQFETDLVSAQNRVNPDFLEKKSPGFILSNLRYSRNIKLKKIDIQFMFAIENLFNKNYYEHLDIMKIARPGRNFIFGFNLSY
jgi:iron complex outermembrane receptor protein